jgi:MATE family, multidrug efflux pump
VHRPRSLTTTPDPELSLRPAGSPPKPFEHRVSMPAGPTSVGPAVSDRTRRLLDGPIVPTLLRLAAPNVVVMTVQAAVSAGEAYFLGWLGADALAGVSLTFPLIMLMQTMSAGGMGGGVSAAVARALGAGRRRDADALGFHALLIAIVMGAGFTSALVLGGPALYRAMGGTGGALAAALTYSNIVFGGAIAVWLFNTLASIVRGTGNMLLPAVVVVGGAVLTLSLSPALIFGWGPLPSYGIAGAAVALVTYYAVGSVVLLVYLLAGRSLVSLARAEMRLQGRLFGEILWVGAPSLLNNIQANLTVVLLTGLVGPFGTAALAGYGMGARLEYLQIPLVFGFGSALVTMVGTNVGAGRGDRAERIAWTGAGMAAALTGIIGLGVALFPDVWLGLFSTDPEVRQAGALYLRIVGPAYGFFGLGLALYFSAQGAGRLLWPVLAGFSRLAIASVGGWLAIHWLGGGLIALFAVMALAFVAFGCILSVGVRSGAFRRGRVQSLASEPKPLPRSEGA